MKFVIRDDDLNYFSSSSDILQWYEDVFKENIPVSFAAIPFVMPHSDVYTGAGPYEKEEYPIGENTELVGYVKSEPNAAIVLHGCNHVTINGVFEYQKTTGLIEDTRRGKVYLEEIFERPIRVFVPPHDQISNHGIRALEENNLALIRSKGAKNTLLRWSTIMVLFKMTLHRLRFIAKPRQSMPAYPFVLSIGKHAEAFSFRIELPLADLLNGLHYIHKKGGDFVIVTHIHDMSGEKKEKLRILIDTAKALDASFVPAEKLFYGA